MFYKMCVRFDNFTNKPYLITITFPQFINQPKTAKNDLKELQRSIQVLAATNDEGM